MVVNHLALGRLIRTYRTPLITRNHVLSLTSLNGTPRLASTMAPRTYDSALANLSLLQSNSAIKSLFAPPPPSPSSKPGPAGSHTRDLNALAIPEMLAWLDRAGISQEKLAGLKYIHVAGTKGKGSVCAYLTSILTRAAGEGGGGEGVDPGRVGTYTSPHLLSVRERIQLDGRPISQDLFAKHFFELWDTFTAAARAESSRRGGAADPDAELEGPATKPFYFRFLTIMALRVFLAEGVRSAVVECGIGGEYDSTNVLPPGAVTASVISQLGVDHVGMLGATLPQIAWHKAGVCKEGRKCFTRRPEGGAAERDTMEVLRRRAAEKGAQLIEMADRDVEAWGGVRGDGCLEGAFQKYNQALAAAAAREHLRILGGGGPEAEAEAQQAASLAALPAFVPDGLRRARLRGRCETREDGDITWFIDGAHTAESLDEVGRWFALRRRALSEMGTGTAARAVLLFNQQERDAPALLRRLLESIGGDLEPQVPGGAAAVFDEAVFTRNELRGRAADEPERDLAVQRAGADAMREISPRTTTLVVDNVADAVARVREIASSRGDGNGGRVAVLVTGSLHLVGALLRALEPEALL